MWLVVTERIKNLKDGPKRQPSVQLGEINDEIKKCTRQLSLCESIEKRSQQLKDTIKHIERKSNCSCREEKNR